jgi:hypothetical protein
LIYYANLKATKQSLVMHRFDELSKIKNLGRQLTRYDQTKVASALDSRGASKDFGKVIRFPCFSRKRLSRLHLRYRFSLPNEGVYFS